MSNDQSKQDFAAALAELRQSFVDRLPEEFEHIDQCLALLKHEVDDWQSHLEHLRQLVHKLAGSSGTFGLESLGKRAKAIELQVKEWQNDKTFAFQVQHHAQLQSGIHELKQSVDQTEPASTFNLERTENHQHTEAATQLWLIEDDQILAKELARQFETFGFEVTIFHDLSSPDEQASTQQPDALVVDVIFEDGKVNATEQLVTCKHLQKLTCPVLFMSAYDDFDSRIRAVQLNAKGYFLKPVSIPAMVTHLRRVYEASNIPDSHILIIEDDQALAQHYQLVLSAAGFTVECLFDPSRVIEKLNEFHPEVVLLDLHMPPYSGMDIAGVIRQHEAWMSLPILYLSAETDILTQSAALEKGAEDFLTKPINDVQLVSTVRARVIRSRQLDEQISRDSLTGLLKHAVIKESIRHEVERSKRSGKPCSVVMIDLDHFKQVNDSYGHSVGDVVISALATVLQQRLRKTDIIGRYGGEEFAAVLPECDSDKACEIFNDILEAFNQVTFSHDTQLFHCSFSAGVICTAEFGHMTGDQILVAADAALYQAKEDGRNRVVPAKAVFKEVS